MKRRGFIQTGILSSLSLSGGLLLSNSWKANQQLIESKLLEGEKYLPIAGQYDVIVCGGGPAGVAAAIEAGRNGAKTLLVELQGCLGGIWTAGLLAWILDQANKPGIMRELENRLKDMDAISPIDVGKNIAFDVEKMKLLLEEMCFESNVDILLHTRVAAAKKNLDNRVTHIITESKSFREAWEGKVFIDATGDGDLAALSGCGFDFGSEEDGSFQPMSLLMIVTGIEFNELKGFVRWSGDIGSASKKKLLQEMSRAGVVPSYLNPSIFPLDKDLFIVMTNHEYESSGLNAKDLTFATLHARRELHKIVSALRSLGKPWNNMRIIATAEQIGVREGRRIHGLYTVTKDDLILGTKHPDAVCTATFGVDVHSVKKEHELKTTGYNLGIKTKPYDIPLRSLIAKDVTGLMMAGRCISGDFIAHSSYRVTGNSVALGEAAGRVAAKAAMSNKLPNDINWKDVN